MFIDSFIAEFEKFPISSLLVSAPPKRSPTLNLNFGGKIFPVKKTVLLEKLGLFQDNPSLLGASEYKVQAKVWPPSFPAFVRILKGAPVNVSATTFESFALLAKEFDFEPLSKKCEAFSVWNRQFCEFLPKTGLSEGELKPVIPSVTVTAEGYPHTYTVLVSSDEIDEFGIRLAKAGENGIEIEGIEADEGDEDIVEKAIETIYSNTMATLPEGNTRKSFGVVFFSSVSLHLSLFDVDSRIYCLNRLHTIAPNSVDVAKYLLLSQCDPSRPNDYVPLPEPKWGKIGWAIRLLLKEKSGETKERMAILRTLKAQRQYNAFLGDGDE
jgi:hypothetical protein